MTKNTLKPIIVLAVICIVVAAMLAGVNAITAPKIEADENEKANAALLVVLPGAKDFEKLDLSDKYPGEIKNAHKADKGFVFEVSVKGKDAMTIMCGVDNDGKLVKLDIVSEAETPDYKSKVFPNVTGDNGAYNGKSSADLAPEIYSGATLTSNGVYSAVKAALDAYTVANGGELAPAPEAPEEPEVPEAPEEPEADDPRILALAEALVPNSLGFTRLSIGEEKYLTALYEENSGKGYVAHVLVMSENYADTVESEALIHIGNDGKIKGINRLVWKTSDAGFGYTPPSADAVDAFYDRLYGTGASTVGGVELVTNATNTSTNVVTSFKEALDAAAEYIVAALPTPEAELLSKAKDLIGNTLGFENVTPEGTQYVRRLYKDKDGNGYVAYVVVISESYGTVESEALIHIGNDGKIQRMYRLVFKTSDAGYGYVPPELSAVNNFYASLPGNGFSTIEGVDLISGATNTSTNVIKSFREALKLTDELLSRDRLASKVTVKALAEALVGEGADLEAVALGETDYVKAIYKDKGGKGYVAHVVVISESYGTVESEALIHITEAGRIKDLQRLNWKTSEAMYGYVPPSQDKVDAFYEALDGVGSTSIKSVDLVSGATNTSANVVKSVKEALSITEGLIASERDEDPTPRIIGIVILALAVIGSALAVVLIRKKRGGKNG